MKTTRILLAAAVCAAMLLAGCGGEDGPKVYTITVSSDGNGTAVADKTTGTHRAIVKLTATANSDYVFWRWIVTSGEVVVSNIWLSSAIVIMPAGNVEIKAEFSSVINPALINGITWAAYNVDAPGTFAANPEDTGMFYQWNRKVGWSSTELVNSDGGTTWDSTYATDEYWAAENDPCPTGWRVPTHEEQVALCDDEKTTYEETTLNGVNGYRFTDNNSGNSVFFPLAGYRFGVQAEPYNVGSYGYYWSATKSPSFATYSYNLYLNSLGNVEPSDYSFRSWGFSVRCVAK